MAQDRMIRTTQNITGSHPLIAPFVPSPKDSKTPHPPQPQPPLRPHNLSLLKFKKRGKESKTEGGRQGSYLTFS